MAGSMVLRPPIYKWSALSPAPIHTYIHTYMQCYPPIPIDFASPSPGFQIPAPIPKGGAVRRRRAECRGASRSSKVCGRRMSRQSL